MCKYTKSGQNVQKESTIQIVFNVTIDESSLRHCFLKIDHGSETTVPLLQILFVTPSSFVLSVLVESPLSLHFCVHFQFSVRFNFYHIILHEYLVDLVDKNCIHSFILQIGAHCRKVQVCLLVIF